MFLSETSSGVCSAPIIRTQWYKKRAGPHSSVLQAPARHYGGLGIGVHSSGLSKRFQDTSKFFRELFWKRKQASLGPKKEKERLHIGVIAIWGKILFDVYTELRKIQEQQINSK